MKDTLPPPSSLLVESLKAEGSKKNPARPSDKGLSRPTLELLGRGEGRQRPTQGLSRLPSPEKKNKPSCQEAGAAPPSRNPENQGSLLDCCAPLSSEQTKQDTGQAQERWLD